MMHQDPRMMNNEEAQWWCRIPNRFHRYKYLYIYIYVYTYIHVDMYMKNMCVYLESRYLLQTCFVFILPGNVFPFDYYVANSLKPPPTIMY